MFLDDFNFIYFQGEEQNCIGTQFYVNDNNNNKNNNNSLMAYKYWVGIQQGIAMSRGQEELVSLDLQYSQRWCLDKNTAGCGTLSSLPSK